MERPLGAIFDLDGTLLDSMGYWVEAPVECLRTVYGKAPRPGLADALNIRTIEEGGAWMAEEYGLGDSGAAVCAKIKELMRAHYQKDILPVDGALAWLSYFRDAGVPMAVATNTDRDLVELALRRWDMDGYFRAVFTTSEVGAGKGRPDIFETALAFLATPRERTWVFEDAPFAMETAKAAGFPVAAVGAALEADARERAKALGDVYIEDFSRQKPWF